MQYVEGLDRSEKMEQINISQFQLNRIRVLVDSEVGSVMFGI